MQVRLLQVDPDRFLRNRQRLFYSSLLAEEEAVAVSLGSDSLGLVSMCPLVYCGVGLFQYSQFQMYIRVQH